jgi:hypothetical protein
MSKDRHYVIYPFTGWIGNRELTVDYKDAKANKKLASDFMNETTIEGMMDALQDAGIYTFGEPSSANDYDDIDHDYSMNG